MPPTLWEAAAANDVAALAERLSECSDTHVNLLNEGGASALHCAATFGCVRAARFLLEHAGADVHLPDRESGWTALHRALYHGCHQELHGCHHQHYGGGGGGGGGGGANPKGGHLRVALLLIRHGALLGDELNVGRPWQRKRNPLPPPPLRLAPPPRRADESGATAAAAGGSAKPAAAVAVAITWTMTGTRPWLC